MNEAATVEVVLEAEAVAAVAESQSEIATETAVAALEQSADATDAALEAAAITETTEALCQRILTLVTETTMSLEVLSQRVANLESSILTVSESITPPEETAEIAETVAAETVLEILEAATTETAGESLDSSAEDVSQMDAPENDMHEEPTRERRGWLHRPEERNQRRVL